MSKCKLTLLSASLAVSSSVFAGGLLTNTNQNIAFNRNFAREATIGIDGVYSNPAGVAFMKDGLHLSFNFQNVYQTRTIYSGLAIPTGTPDNYIFPFTMNDVAPSMVKKYEGKATVPVLPSFQAAYNKDRLSLQFAFGLFGGGGKATFNNGLGSFEQPISMIPLLLQQIPPMQSAVPTYGYDSYLSGRQYIFGAQLGAAYKINENISVYGGFRVNYVHNKYEGHIKNIRANVANQNVLLSDFMKNHATTLVANYISDMNTQLAASQQQLAALQTQIAGITDAAQRATLQAQYDAGQARFTQAQAGLQRLSGMAGNLSQYQALVADKYVDATQTGWGVTPIIGVDVKLGKWNFASKFEFNTHLNIQNDTKADDIRQFENGKNVPHDVPALLTLGTQYEITPEVRVMAGWHHYFDKSARMADNKQKLLKHNTNEFLAGAEWDITKRILVSAGTQFTRYGLGNGDYLTDMSFVTSSYSLGFGAKFKLTEKVNLNVAYFWTDYEKFERTKEGTVNNTPAILTDDFTRTNKVFGVGVDISL